MRPLLKRHHWEEAVAVGRCCMQKTSPFQGSLQPAHWRHCKIYVKLHPAPCPADRVPSDVLNAAIAAAMAAALAQQPAAEPAVPHPVIPPVVAATSPAPSAPSALSMEPSLAHLAAANGDLLGQSAAAAAAAPGGAVPGGNGRQQARQVQPDAGNGMVRHLQADWRNAAPWAMRLQPVGWDGALDGMHACTSDPRHPPAEVVNLDAEQGAHQSHPE